MTPRRAQPCHVIRDGFPGLRQHHRSAADHGAQENLQAAVAADVVQRRPGRVRVARRPVGDDRAGQPIERMSDDLRQPGRARGQHQPLGRAFGLPSRGRPFGQAGADDQVRASIASVQRPIGDDGVDLGIRKQGLDAIRIEVGRAQKHAAGDAVEFDHRERGQQLPRRRKQHRSAGQLAGSADQAAVPENVGQRYAVPGIGNRAALQLRAEIFAQREDLRRGHSRML